MPEKTAVKTNNYAIMPVSTVLAVATVVLIFLKAFHVISIPWLIVFAPMAIWLGIIVAAGLIFVTIVALVALLQIWK